MDDTHRGPCVFILSSYSFYHRNPLYFCSSSSFFVLCPVQEAQAYAEDNGLLFMETSAKTAMNVNEIFMAIGKGRDRQREREREREREAKKKEN